MAFRRRKGLTKEVCLTLIFNSDSDDSDIDIEENFSDNDTSLVCPPANENLLSSDIKDQAIQNEDISLTWSSEKNLIDVKRKKFDVSPGPKHSLTPGSLELDYLKLLFSDGMIENIRQNTNKYAEFVAEKRKKADGSWKSIDDPSKMLAFISILLIMSLVRMSKLRDYWSTNPILGHTMVKQIMPRNRFFKILQYFHISDRSNELEKDHPNYNIFQKLEPLAENLKNNFRDTFSPYKEMSVDEALIKFKGRLGIVQ